MLDQLGRRIDYMRISVTDRCNLRCRYCMPEEIVQTAMEQLLTYEELARVVSAAVSLGIVHFRLTGGEPLVRRKLHTLVSMIKQTPGVKTVTMTTNGVALAEQAGKLKEAGLDGVNVSLDTLDREEFAAWTGRDSLEQVLDGIRTVQELGIPMKLNAVLAGAQSCEKPAAAALLTGIQRCEKLIAFAQEYGLCLRFIEMMPIGYGSQYACRETQDLLNELEKRYGRAEPLERKAACYGSGPAVYYHFEKLQQPVGLIRAIHESFCAGCNRVRLTAEGRLKLCLCYEDSVDLRAVLRSGQTDGDLADSIREAVWRKPAQHCFGESKGITEKELMGRIGG